MLCARILEHHLNIHAVVTDGIKGSAKLRALLNSGAYVTRLGTDFVICPRSNANFIYYLVREKSSLTY